MQVKKEIAQQIKELKEELKGILLIKKITNDEIKYCDLKAISTILHK